MSTTLFKNCTVGITGMSGTLSHCFARETYDLDCWNEQYDHSDVHDTTGAAPAAIPLFSALSVPKHVVFKPTGTTTRSKNCNCGISTVFCTTALYHHSVDELNEAPKTAGTCAACTQGRPQPQRQPSSRRPVLKSRHGLAVNLGGGSTGCGRCPTSTSRPPQVQRSTNSGHLHPQKNECGTTLRHDRRHFHQLVHHARRRNESRGRRRHFQQLFRHLRITTQASRRKVVNEDLGHFNNLLRHRDVQELADRNQLFSHQRHRNIERRQEGHAVANLFHCVPLNPLLRPDASEAVKPGESSGTLSSSSSVKCCVPGSWESSASGTSPCTASRTPPPSPCLLLTS